jgi:hypothetical protein
MMPCSTPTKTTISAVARASQLLLPAAGIVDQGE